MALNNSGIISIGGSTVGVSINLELGLLAGASSNLGQPTFRTLAQVPSGQINMSDFYGKANIIPYPPINVNTTQLTLTPANFPGYVAGSAKISIQLGLGTYLYSTDVNAAALTLSGFTAGDVISIESYGNLIGKGGDGHTITYRGVNYNNTYVTGQNGGHAIELIGGGFTLNYTNYLALCGGGGGGNGISYLGGGGGGAGGGKGGDSMGPPNGQSGAGAPTAIGGAGGGPDQVGGTGGMSPWPWDSYIAQGAGGGGGRKIPGSGGAGGAPYLGIGTNLFGGSGGGAGGGGGANVNPNQFQLGQGPGQAGGSAGNSPGVNNLYAIGSGGGGGWGAAGGAVSGALPQTVGGRAIKLNGNICNMTNYGTIYGAIS